MIANSYSFAYKISLFMSAFFYLFIEAKATNKVTIIATGETHAMVYPCDCREGPVGGMARRAHIIKEMRNHDSLILVDAGAYSGGGMYDLYTRGYEYDSIRTLITMLAMADMGYDAAAVGDEDLQYCTRWLTRYADKIGMPLVSANCRYSSGEYITEPFVIVKKKDIKFGITSVTTNEKLLSLDTSVVIHDPVQSINIIWEDLKVNSDCQIILSHLGEENTQLLGAHFPECNIIVNGHRKVNRQPVITLDKQIIMQFGYQGKELSSVEIKMEGDDISFINKRWIPVSDLIPVDTCAAKIISILDTITDIKFSTVMDLYIMSQCLYGRDALSEVLNFYEEFPHIELHLFFIGDIIQNVKDSGSRLHSLNGGGEVLEEKRWLAVKSIYPEMWHSFLYLCVTDNLPLETVYENLELDTVLINRWVKEYGNRELESHYFRSKRLAINASPTLFLNNIPFDGEISFLRLAKDFCRGIKDSSRAFSCNSVPECFRDEDCREKGKIGRCIAISDRSHAGKCLFQDAVQFDFYAVIPDCTVLHPEKETIATTKSLFPGAQIHLLSVSSNQGKKFLKKINPPCIPLYLFDKRIQKAFNFEKIETGLTDASKWFTFKSSVMRKHYFYKREYKKNSLEIFIDPVFKGVKDVIHTLLKHSSHYKEIKILPIVYQEGAGELFENDQEVRREEAVRWIVLSKYYSDVYIDYLKQYRVQIETKERLDLLKKMKIDINDFSDKVNEGMSLLLNLEKSVKELEIEEPVEMLFENRELIVLKSPDHLETILNEIKSRGN